MGKCQYFEECPIRDSTCKSSKKILGFLPTANCTYSESCFAMLLGCLNEKKECENMARLAGMVTIYRPCTVKDKKALFHRWEDCANIVPPSPLMGGHSGGQFRQTYGIVEFEDGAVAEVEPSLIKFVPGIFKDYLFGGNE